MRYLGELHDEFPLGLGDHHKNGNHHRVTPEYPIEYLHLIKRNSERSDPQTRRGERKERRRREYIRSVLERSDGGEDIDGDAENGGERSDDAEAAADNQESIWPRTDTDGGGGIGGAGTLRLLHFSARD